MQLSFADAQKLLISAKEYNCVILLDSVPVDVVCHVDTPCRERQGFFFLRSDLLW